MPLDIEGWLSALEERTPSLFLVAGVVLVGYAALNGIWAVTGSRVEPNLFEVGYVLGFLGLVGLYPQFAGRQPWLGRIGAVAAVLGAVAIAAFNVRHVAELAGLVSEAPPEPLFVSMTLVGFVVGYLAFGVAALRSEAYSGRSSLLISVPGFVVVLMLVHIALGWNSPSTAFVISAGQAMAHLAIGASLRAGAESAEREGEDVEGEPAPDATAKG